MRLYLVYSIRLRTHVQSVKRFGVSGAKKKGSYTGTLNSSTRFGKALMSAVEWEDMFFYYVSKAFEI
jgi:hypothetical protein